MANENKQKTAQVEVPKEAPAAGALEAFFRNAKGQLVPEKYRGTFTYLLKQPHYRSGDYLQAGETITVTDEKPSRTWEPVQPRAAVVQARAPEKVDRPSDMSV